ncbi:hypothetical protein [Lachnospira eligens]|uniref:hypothetical protein n=1 Tax=Lachnospira eligens TaxID=39485 RepID=UPI000E5CE9CE|nr:hypothetical protein [Lachnospira eligens]RGZ73585.1 hypothetical protein DW976_01710 [Lachnospira eligens]RHK87869.1 hypothetical protein DW044_03275 [Lachnospira eligens]
MSLTIRSTMNNQAAAQGIDNTDKNTDNSKQTKNRKTINASELNLKPYKDNQIDAKRLRARKQAMSLYLTHGNLLIRQIRILRI